MRLVDLLLFWGVVLSFLACDPPIETSVNEASSNDGCDSTNTSIEYLTNLWSKSDSIDSQKAERLAAYQAQMKERSAEILNEILRIDTKNMWNQELTYAGVTSLEMDSLQVYLTDGHLVKIKQYFYDCSGEFVETQYFNQGTKLLSSYKTYQFVLDSMHQEEWMVIYENDHPVGILGDEPTEIPTNQELNRFDSLENNQLTSVRQFLKEQGVDLR